MKKKIISIFLLFFLLYGCGQINNSNNIIKQEKIDKEPNKSVVCSDLCGNKIQKLCKEEIESNKFHSIDIEGSIIDEASCLLMCETNWSEKQYDCVTLADSCAQFLDNEPYCIETEEENEETLLPNNCDTACKNYAKCTGYGDDVTQEDQNYAYESCLKICGNWTDETRKCISTTKINNSNDCASQSLCIFGK